MLSAVQQLSGGEPQSYIRFDVNPHCNTPGDKRIRRIALDYLPRCGFMSNQN